MKSDMLDIELKILLVRKKIKRFFINKFIISADLGGLCGFFLGFSLVSTFQLFQKAANYFSNFGRDKKVGLNSKAIKK